MQDLQCLILAAGASRRFGSPKQAALFDGITMLELAVRCALSVAPAPAITVVLGPASWSLRRVLEPYAVRAVNNPDSDEGIGASIRCGIRELPGEARAILIMLADQPGVTASDLAALVAGWRENTSHRVAAEYAGIAGAPAIFPRADFGLLAGLRGDRGARQVLLDGGAPLRLVPMPNAAFDIDTVQDLEAFAGRPILRR